jgi:histidinol phosphatase-like PHP family hydrolase
MILDLHTHTFFSDGELVPAELIQRARKKGYGVLGITDHADFSNYQQIVENLLKAKEFFSVYQDIKILIGVELTHIPPSQMKTLVKKSRMAGAEVVIVHGETMVEPVEEGTNLAALDSGADILSHPGFITGKEAELAAKNGVFLEISYRKGHSLTNGYVAKIAREYSAPLIIGSDAHAPGDLFSDFETYKKVALAAAIEEVEFDRLYDRVKQFVLSKISI